MPTIGLGTMITPLYQRNTFSHVVDEFQLLNCEVFI